MFILDYNIIINWLLINFFFSKSQAPREIETKMVALLPKIRTSFGLYTYKYTYKERKDVHIIYEGVNVTFHIEL